MQDSLGDTPKWLEDPTGRHEFRYWDGVEWTEDVADQGWGSVEGTVPRRFRGVEAVRGRLSGLVGGRGRFEGGFLVGRNDVLVVTDHEIREFDKKAWSGEGTVAPSPASVVAIADITGIDGPTDIDEVKVTIGTNRDASWIFETEAEAERFTRLVDRLGVTDRGGWVGWRADPTGRHELRYWDGVEWTEDVADQGWGSVDGTVPRTFRGVEAARGRLSGLVGGRGRFEGGFLVDTNDVLVVTDHEIREFDKKAWSGEGTVAPSPASVHAIGDLTGVQGPTNVLHVVTATFGTRPNVEWTFTTWAEGERFVRLLDRLGEIDHMGDSPQWLPDPTGRHELRYWDGSEWTEDVSDQGWGSVEKRDEDLGDGQNGPHGGAESGLLGAVDVARERLPDLLGEQGDFEGAFLLESPDGLVVVTDREIRLFDEAAWDEEQTSAPEPVETIAIGDLTDVSHPSFWNPVKVRFLTGFMTRRTRWESSPVAAETAFRVEHELDFTTRAEGSRFAGLVDRVKEASRGRDGIQFLYQSGRGYPLSEGVWLEGKSERGELVLATRDGGTEIRMRFAQVRAIDLGVDTVRTTELFWGNYVGPFAVQDWVLNKTVEFVTSVATTKNDVTTVRIVTDQGEVNLITADGSPTAIETRLNEGRHHQGDPPSEGPPSTPTWFADPTGRHEYRLWDGQDWTDQVADHGTTATDPLPARPADGSDPPPAAP